MLGAAPFLRPVAPGARMNGTNEDYKSDNISDIEMDDLGGSYSGPAKARRG